MTAAIRDAGRYMAAVTRKADLLLAMVGKPIAAQQRAWLEIDLQLDPIIRTYQGRPQVPQNREGMQ